MDRGAHCAAGMDRGGQRHLRSVVRPGRAHRLPGLLAKLLETQTSTKSQDTAGLMGDKARDQPWR